MEIQATPETAESVVVSVDEFVAPSDSFLFAVTHQTPWWIVSVLLHALVITLAGLLTVAIDLSDDDIGIVIVNDVFQTRQVTPEPTRPEPKSINVLKSEEDERPSNGKDTDGMKVLVPDEILARFEHGEEFLVKSDPQEQLGLHGSDPKSSTFYPGATGSADEGGGSGELSDMVTGLGDSGSLGFGHGNSIGNGNGDRPSTIGFPTRWAPKTQIGRHVPSAFRRPLQDKLGLSLRWLAYHQESDGHWDARKYGASFKSDTAVTGLALLTFLGGGHSEKIGEYRAQVKQAVAWLKSKQSADGCLFDTSDDSAVHRRYGYPCAIATLAMAEAAGMANVPDTRAAAQKAIDYCTEKHQQGEGSDRGGFRYAPRSEGDLSVTGWFIMAMKSAKMAGLHVNPAAFDGAIRFLDSVEVKEAGGNGYAGASHYKYTRSAEHPDSAHRLTAIGTLARQFMGWKKEDLQASVDGFVAKGGVPEYGANGERVDLYYWYYGSMCTFQQQGDVWKRWNAGMLKALLENQSTQGDELGSWTPAGAYSGEWGRVGQTALSTLCLEVYWRYQLFH